MLFLAPLDGTLARCPSTLAKIHEPDLLEPFDSASHRRILIADFPDAATSIRIRTGGFYLLVPVSQSVHRRWKRNNVPTGRGNNAIRGRGLRLTAIKAASPNTDRSGGI